ncbi:hypothetical protein QTP86_032008 [Hemibagrus guttatus]|nr:hypothetical protein QTP86_032008 [Hemibagrus guttatus]
MCVMDRRGLLTVLCVLWSVVCVTECVRRHRRSDTCETGFYNTSEGRPCCLCPQGFFLVEDCTSPRGDSVCKECEIGTYLDHSNKQRKCEPCKTCSSNENKEEKNRCSPSSNTVCRCQEGYYCPKEECKVCYQCNKCEFGVKVACTLTSDTQCNEQSADIKPWVLAVIIALCLIMLGLLVFFWRQKLLCFKSHEAPEDPQVLEPLGDPNLEPFLPKIAEILGFKVVRNMVKRNGLLNQAKIDNIMDEHPRDANERAYQLLLAWYQKHGMNGACKTLCDTLTDMSMRVEAKKVHDLIKEGQSNEEERQNGHV